MTRAPRFPNPWPRRLAWITVLLLLPVLWKLGWNYGTVLARNPDGTTPALLAFKAKAVLLAELGFPRTLELTVAAPESGSSAAAQLQLMGYWDGKGWAPKATALGRVQGRSLLVNAGTLDLEAVDAVGPARDEEGRVKADVTYRLRWTFNDALQDLYQHRSIVPFRAPRGMKLDAPGKSIAEKAVLVRQGLTWKAEPDPARKPDVGARSTRWSWLPLLF